jgi:Xaa-Pro aminopeptidase
MLKDIRAATQSAVEAFHVLKKQITVGMTEKQVARVAKRVLVELGGEKLAFPVIAACTENAATPHHVPTSRRIQDRDLLVLDMGCVVNGMRSDMTRTLFFGRPRATFVGWYEDVLEAQKRAYRAVRAGRHGTEIDGVARRYLTSAGVGDLFIHSLGHGLGAAIHQVPWVGPRKKGRDLRAGDVITIEPGVYKKDVGGIRIEDACEVTATGARWLVPQQRHISRMIIQ